MKNKILQQVRLGRYILSSISLSKGEPDGSERLLSKTQVHGQSVATEGQDEKTYISDEALIG